MTNICCMKTAVPNAFSSNHGYLAGNLLEFSYLYRMLAMGSQLQIYMILQIMSLG
jgi:hypothetical protein